MTTEGDKLEQQVRQILEAVRTKGYNDAPGNPDLPHLLMGKELSIDEAGTAVSQLIEAAQRSAVVTELGILASLLDYDKREGSQDIARQVRNRLAQLTDTTGEGE